MGELLQKWLILCQNKNIMTFKTAVQVLETYKTVLKSIYPREEIRNFVIILFEYKLGFSKVDFIMKGADELTPEMIDFCTKALAQLKEHIPIQYIIGETEFYGLKFKVTHDVLIPRPETEELVHWIISDNKLSNPQILDIGTGSGCIPITLKKHIPAANITTWDISEKALCIANENATLNKVDVIFVQNDVLKTSLQKNKTFDIIVSNPPYIRELEKKHMHQNVLNYEPHLALFVSDNNPLIFYKQICKLAFENLNPGGILYFEINEALGDDTKLLMKYFGFTQVEVRKDLFGKDRMAKGIK